MHRSLIFLFTLSALRLLAQGTQSKGPVVIDQFTSVRKSDSYNTDNRLWKEYPQTYDSTWCDHVGTIANGIMPVTAPPTGVCSGQVVNGMTGPGLSNILWFPSGNGWPWASPCTPGTHCEYTQAWAQTVPAGTDWTALNRMYFSITGDQTFNTGGGPGAAGSIGYYIRSHDNSSSQNQGAHFYNYLYTSLYAGQPLYLVLNRKPIHNNTQGPTTLYAEDTEFNQCCFGQGNSTPIHWWDGETTFYFEWGTTAGVWTGNFTVTPFSLGVTTGEPDDYVAGVAGTYTGNNPGLGKTVGVYEVSWSEPKLVPGGVNYHVYYSSKGSMHVSGLSSGTSSGSVRGWDGSGNSAYANVWWNSPHVSQSPNMWVAIRPDIPIWSVTGTSPITIKTRAPYDRHWLKTGDQVTVSNLCSTANGTRTVTVIDNFTLSLGVSGACSYSGYAGTGSGTITATSDTTNFTEILIGPGTTATSPCDVNGDGVVNSTDYSLAQGLVM